MLTSFSSTADARKSLLSGDYESDTVSVTKTLGEIISTPIDSEDASELENDAVALIYEYISKYRPRREINERVSYTTMQTALNSLAGHYKTFPNRPIPGNLKTDYLKNLNKQNKVWPQKNKSIQFDLNL